MKSIFLPILAVLPLFIGACGGSSSRSYTYGEAKTCAENYSPLQFDLSQDEKYQKLNWPQGTPTEGTLPEGDFEYLNMEMFFVTKATGFALHVKDQKAADNSYVAKIVCGRHVGSENNGLRVSMELPSVSKVQASGKMLFESKTISVAYADSLKVTSGVAPGETDQPPSKVTDGQGLQTQIYKVATSAADEPQSYELRVTSEDEHFKKFGVIRFTKKVLPQNP